MQHLDLEAVFRDYLEDLVLESLPGGSEHDADALAVAVHRAFARFNLADCFLRLAARHLYGDARAAQISAQISGKGASR